MFRGLLHLLNTGEEYKPVGSEKYIWPTLREQYQRNLDNYQQKCETNRANSKKASEARKAKKTPTDTEGLPTDTEGLSFGYKEKENDNENEKENENESV